MGLLERANNLLKANVNHLMDKAEDPEVMIKQLIRDMDEAVAELRRETVNAVAREKQLKNKVKTAQERTAELEKKAALALDHDNEELARKILAEKVASARHAESVAEELAGAVALSRQMKTDLVRMQKQASVARRKQDELIRRKRSAEAQMRTQEAARRSADAVSAASGRIGEVASNGSAFDGYADAIDELQARAEAARELADDRDDSEEQLQELEQRSEVDAELERLKSARATG